jgi:hypothetical protein
MATPIFINGVQHAWADISVNMLGRTLTGITAISYGSKRNKENIYGAGDEPIGRGHGNNEYTNPSMEVYQFEAVALQQASAGDITRIPPFEIVVSYKATLNSPMVVDVIQNCEFLNNLRDIKQGDTSSKVKLDLICAGIKMHSI